MAIATKPDPTKRKRDKSSDITPDLVGRKYVRREDKRLRDAPVAYTPEGKRIYAYNASGQPICHSKRPGEWDEDTGTQLRCQSIATMHNGRCKLHGGKSPAGVMHYRATHLRTSDCMPSHLQGDFNRAMLDPDLLDLKHEIALIDLEIKDYKMEMGSDVGSGPMAKLGGLLDKLEGALEDGDEVTEDMLMAIVKVYKAGKTRDATNRKMHAAMEMRRRLVDTAHHREKDLKTMIRADQALALITSVAAACKEAVEKLMTSIAERYILIDRNNLVGLNTRQRQELEEIGAQSVDKAVKLDFLSDVSIKLGGLIGKARETMPGDPSTQTSSANPLAIVRRPKAVAAVIASGEE